MTLWTKRENLVTYNKTIRKYIKRKHPALTGKATTVQQKLEKEFKPVTQLLKKKLIYTIHQKMQI